MSFIYDCSTITITNENTFCLYYYIYFTYERVDFFQADQENVEEPESSDLVKNTNALDVAAAARERREQARQDAQRKKEKDKEDR